ncbi:outer membrane protein assembly factor BamE [Novosphingobium piscinae]|nr:outer membrane protein assembly factor BamE [Novosphingobium piscinae]
MQVFSRLVMGGAVLAALAGCSSIQDHRGYLIDQALIDSVQPGVDNKLSVERTLGRPTFVAQFGAPAWYYVSIDTRQAAFTRPQPKQQTILRITFDDAGNVSGIDKRGVEKVVRLDPDGHKTPTLGRDRSFLEDLFGNIGAVGAAGMGGPAQGGNTGTGPNGS